MFFRKPEGGYALCSIEERVALIQSLGVDEVVVVPFTRQLVETRARDFMTQLKTTLGIQKLLAGEDFTLGKDREGTITTLSQLGKQIGYDVQPVAPYKLAGEMVSSTLIRKYLKNGLVAKANLFLGRHYSIKGKVIHGEQRGGKLGIPTANLEIPPERLIPANGVYATRAWIAGKTYQSVTNIGVRPTFEKIPPLARVEPHLLDVQLDLYGQEVTLEFIEFLRPEQKFPGPQALIEQINRDIHRTREIFTREN